MNADPEGGRVTTGKGRDHGPSRGEPLGTGSVLGLSTPSAKCLSLPVGDGLRLDLDPRRGPARLSSRYGESPASVASPVRGGRRAPVPAASEAQAKLANDKAAAASERLPAGGVSK